MKPMKKIALLHSLCSVGKASITNMLPVLSVVGVETCPIPTILLSTHTGGYGVPARQEISADYIRSCADHYVAQNILFDAIFVGYLGNGELGAAIQYFVEKFPTAIKVMDPIMGDNGNLYNGINTECIEAYKNLCAISDILLPNFTEACLLSGCEYKDFARNEEVEHICKKIHTFGPKELVITGICLEDGKRLIAHSMAGKVTMMPVEYESESFHGTGDLFDAIFLSSYLQEKSVEESIVDAHNFVRRCIRESVSYDYPKKEGLLLERVLTELV